jgi:hypothetical protein
MKLGVANHGIENLEFINPPLELADKMKAEKVDLFDPSGPLPSIDSPPRWFNPQMRQN